MTTSIGIYPNWVSKKCRGGGKGWQAITPDEHGDWLKQRDDSFSEFIVIGDKVIVQAPVLIRGMVQIDLTSHLRW